MYRLIISEMPSISGRREFRIRSKNGKSYKLATVSRVDILCRDEEILCRDEEILYQVEKQCKAAIRDCLFIDYGRDWNIYENKHKKAIEASIKSALRRAA